MDERIEPIKRKGDVSLGNKYFWHRYKYLVEVKQKEKDICRVVVLESSKDTRETSIIPAGHVMWVFMDDLKKQ